MKDYLYPIIQSEIKHHYIEYENKIKELLESAKELFEFKHTEYEIVESVFTGEIIRLTIVDNETKTTQFVHIASDMPKSENSRVKDYHYILKDAILIATEFKESIKQTLKEHLS